MSEDPARVLVERDALKTECIRLMDEVATLKRQAEDAANLRAALRLLQEDNDRLRAERACGKTLDCGGACHLPPGHHPPCLCSGDMDGPGSCPA